MAYPIRNDIGACVNRERCESRFEGNCTACYYDYASPGNSWHGPQSCYNSGCVKLDMDRYKPFGS